MHHFSSGEQKTLHHLSKIPPGVSDISHYPKRVLTGYNPGQQGGAYGVTSAISNKTCGVCSIDRRVWDHTIDPWETSYTHEVSTGS